MSFSVLPMPEKVKRILKKVGGWIAFLAVIGLLSAGPNLYWWRAAGQWNGREAVCRTESVGEKNVGLQEITLRPDYWNFQTVAVSGKLSYAPGRGIYYLRDGIFMIPVDLSDCQNLDGFGTGETLVRVQGTVAVADSGPLLEVTELRETAPSWAQIMYNAGAWGGILLLIIGLSGLFSLFRKFLVLIRIMKPKPAPSAETVRDGKAVSLLVTGIGAPFIWVFNPIAGAGMQAHSLIANWDGLRSRKRKVAIAGAILCGAGLIVMLAEGISFGRFEKPYANFYAGAIGPLSATVAPTGDEPLEMKPYTNEQWNFSIHPPKGWPLDESAKGEFAIAFNGPQLETAGGQPFYATIGFNILQFREAEAIDLENFSQAVKRDMQKLKNFALLGESSGWLAGGRVETATLEATLTDEQGVGNHVLAILAVKNNFLYILGAKTTTATWDRYGPVIQDSLRTFAAWQGNFASCLKGEGAVFYGAFDCEYCQEQKELFTDGIERLPYVECHDPAGKYQLEICVKKSIESYPTWEFADGSRFVGTPSLQTLAERTGCPLPK